MVHDLFNFAAAASFAMQRHATGRWSAFAFTDHDRAVRFYTACIGVIDEPVIRAPCLEWHLGRPPVRLIGAGAPRVGGGRISGLPCAPPGAIQATGEHRRGPASPKPARFKV
jgi:hypothetical protein